MKQNKKVDELKKMNTGKLISLLFDHDTSPTKIANYLGVSRQYVYQLMDKFDVEIKKKAGSKITLDNDKEID